MSRQARRRVRLERELAALRGKLAQLRAELEEVSLRGRWQGLDDDLSERADGREWDRQARALESAVAEIERRIFSVELELL